MDGVGRVNTQCRERIFPTVGRSDRYSGKVSLWKDKDKDR